MTWRKSNLGILSILERPEARLVNKLSIETHRELLNEKEFLKKLYVHYYKIFKKYLEDCPIGKIIEVGSGAGFIKDIIPECITSDLQENKYCDMIFNVYNMPFDNETLSAILMLGTLHHISDPERFFSESQRCLKKDGKIIMIEPYISLFSRWLYKCHAEPFNEKVREWKSRHTGLTEGVNVAIPHLIFIRDRELFEKKFLRLHLNNIDKHTIFSFILSGGLSMRTLAPVFMFDMVMMTEKLLSFLADILAMRMTIEVRKL